MLALESAEVLSEVDRQVFDLVVPADHYLRLVRANIDFERFRPRLVEAYASALGRPAIDPVRMLKILFLRFHYRLSDAAVMKRLQTDMAFRYFLDLPLAAKVPDSSSNTYFRNRIGEERFTAVFQDLVTLAREAGLVRDRLRLKDATHMIANAADTIPLVLLAQVRDRLLRAALPFFADWVAQQRRDLDSLRQTTAEFPAQERFIARLEYLRQMTEQLQARMLSLPNTPKDATRQRLDQALEVASKLFADQADPQAKDQLASAIDAEARVGKHGAFYLGYSMDIAIDADSEIITAINVLPANGAEAADAIDLIQQEESAQGNDVQGLSIDGAGYNGPVLRELTDPNGLNLDVTVPPPEVMPTTLFGPERFTLTILGESTAELTCPNGQTTQTRERNQHDTGYKYSFKPQHCAGCPLRTQCLQNPGGNGGRKVIKNDYEAEYRKVREKVGTEQYQHTRKTHAKIERKLGELARHHGARRACYRGRPKAKIQALLTGFVVNAKRILRLLEQKMKSALLGETLRAEAAQM